MRVLEDILFFITTGTIFQFTRKKETTQEKEGYENIDLLCQFVNSDNGKHLGESVAIDKNDILIIKNKNRFLGIPLKHIEQEEKTLLVKGLIDYDKAYEMGDSWRDKSFHLLDEEPTSE